MKTHRLAGIAFAALALLAAPAFAGSPTASEMDDFEDGTVENWAEGGPSPNPPFNVADGGPTGAGDNYLENLSAGGSGAGSRWAMFNRTQWSGDYAALGPEVTIQLDVNHFTITLSGDGIVGNDLQLRVGIEGTGGDRWVTTSPVVVPEGGGWVTASFILSESEMTQVLGTDPFATTISDVFEFRLLSATSAVWEADPAAHRVGVDNIEIASVPVELQSFSID